MQVGVGLDRLKNSRTFQDTSKGFTFFTPLALLAMASFLLAILVVSNPMATLRYEKRRFVGMKRARSYTLP